MKIHAMLVAGLLAGCGLIAQEQASTLLQLADRADVVVHARAVSVAEPEPGTLAVTFARLELLRGRTDAAFTLREAGDRCCGRALFTVVPQRDYLLLLERRSGELHVLAGDRGLVDAEAAVLQHVRALLAATTPSARAALLAAALSAGEDRLRRDAAHDLAQLPAAAVPPGVSAALRSALAAGLEHETSLLPALLAASNRFAAAAVDELVLPAYLDDRRQTVRGLLLTALQQRPPARLGEALQQHWPRHDAGRRRAAALLASMPASEARPLQLRLLRETAAPGTALPLCEALLQQGCSAAELQGLAPAVVLQLAARRNIRPPGFRAVQPQR